MRTWSSNSLRSVPTKRSAKAFMSGARIAVRTTRTPDDLNTPAKRDPSFASLSQTTTCLSPIFIPEQDRPPPCPPDPVSPLRGCLVSVTQASEPRPRHSSAAWNLGYCRATAGGSSLRKRVVRSIVVIVGDVLVQQSSEVALVEHDDLVEQLSAHTAYPAFCNAVLPRAPVRRPRWPQTKRFHHGDHTLTEACVAIKHQVA